MQRVAPLGVLALLGVAASASALTITGGPTYSPPGGGSCSVSPAVDATHGPSVQQATVTCSGLTPSANTHLYFGIRNDQFVNGDTMTGTAPAASSSAVFRFASVGSNSITYAGANPSTTVFDSVSGTHNVNTQLVLALTSGTGSVVAAGGNPASNGNGDITDVFQVTSSSFTVTVNVDAKDDVFTTFGNSAPTVFDPTLTRDGVDRDLSHVDLAFYYSSCGDGVVDSPEQCDQGSANGTAASCCSATCTFKSNGTACTDDGNPCTTDTCNGSSATCQHPAGNAGTVCRAAAGICDVAEQCTGSSTTCPADQLQPTTFVCRPSVGVCDIAETCNGSSPFCPNDTFQSSSTVCRASTGVCDPAENCPGNGPNCPADVLSPSSTVCRPAAGPCDVAENCDGSDVDCPTDAFAPSTTVCRAAAGVCDVAESCTGLSAACPTDLKSTDVCRPSTDVCDAAESCDGVNNDCPPDAFQPATVQCRASAGVCDPAENCTGGSAACPADAKSTAVCRPAVDVCDVAESCDGVSNDCPADGFMASSVECRPAAGVCDVAENCTGSSAFCPADAKSTAVCRPAVDVCDVTESCDGISNDCPANALQPSTFTCRPAAGVCDIAENCTGTNAACPADAFASSTTVCRASAGVCDVAESCTGTSAACPADAFASSATVCRASAGVCDIAETCPGNGANCPADAKSTAVCRPATDVCDAAESCDGVSNDCPVDGFQDSTVVCRAAAGPCDVAESCTGTGTACPTDGFQPSTVVCRAATSGCDVTENCTGAAAACPTDTFEPDGTRCPGVDGNTCLHTCQGGTCTDDVVPNCCGNGQPDLGEQCDDGNQSGGDACPSDPAGGCTYTGDLTRGKLGKPNKDKVGCQVEWYVVNPTNPVDKYGLPNRDQACTDNDPTCDLDPTPGQCLFQVVVCVNNHDAALACVPNGISSVTVVPPTARRANIPIIGPNELADVALVRNAFTALLDPNNPGAGYTNAIPLSATQQGLCSEPIGLKVFAPSTTRVSDRRKVQLTIKTKSANNSFPRPRRERSRLRLICNPQ
jgi:hypothetical protein